MKCGDAKTLMALHVGHDTVDPADWGEVQHHCSCCPQCRRHYQGLKRAFASLEQSEAPSTYEIRSSIWPSVSRRLELPRPARLSPMRSWLPLASLTAASLLLGSVWFSLQSPVRDSAETISPRERSSVQLPELIRLPGSREQSAAWPELSPSHEAREAEKRALRGRQLLESHSDH